MNIINHFLMTIPQQMLAEILFVSGAPLLVYHLLTNKNAEEEHDAWEIVGKIIRYLSAVVISMVAIGLILKRLINH